MADMGLGIQRDLQEECWIPAGARDASEKSGKASWKRWHLS